MCHKHKLPAIYHGCGNAMLIYEDFIKMGLDSYNPLEAKSGLDVVELRHIVVRSLGIGGLGLIEGLAGGA